jgi:TatD DNase family protein
MIFDTHCHLNSKELYKDVDKHINDAKNVGVARFLVVGYDLESSKIAVELADKYEEVYAAIGYHPTDSIHASEEEFNQVFSLLKNPKIVALGEIGLDYHWVEAPSERKLQQELFIKQIEVANEHGLPIVVHCRDAVEDCLEIIKNHPVKKGGVMHCYSGSLESAYEFIKLGFYISFGGPVTFINGKKPKMVASSIPLDKLLVETDSPYLTPHPYRGQLNSPKHTLLVVEEIARLRGMTSEEISLITYQNALKLFGIKE